MIAASTGAKARPCRVCPKAFVPKRPLQSVCGLRCAKRLLTMQRKADEVREKAQTKARRDALRPLGYWAKQAEHAFNAWIKWRDRDLPCVSCGTTNPVQWHAGHWRSVGACKELRYEETNVWRQCSQCNDYLSGNPIPYRAELVRRIGLPAVEWLEGPHEPKRYRDDDLKRITADYRARLKACSSVPLASRPSSGGLV